MKGRRVECDINTTEDLTALRRDSGVPVVVNNSNKHSSGSSRRRTSYIQNHIHLLLLSGRIF